MRLCECGEFCVWNGFRLNTDLHTQMYMYSNQTVHVYKWRTNRKITLLPYTQNIIQMEYVCKKKVSHWILAANHVYRALILVYRRAHKQMKSSFHFLDVDLLFRFVRVCNDCDCDCNCGWIQVYASVLMCASVRWLCIYTCKITHTSELTSAARFCCKLQNPERYHDNGPGKIPAKCWLCFIFEPRAVYCFLLAVWNIRQNIFGRKTVCQVNKAPKNNSNTNKQQQQHQKRNKGGRER